MKQNVEVRVAKLFWLVLLGILWSVPSEAGFCTTVSVNLKGSSGADITVDSTSGGVTVADASTSRCELLIQNSSANDMRCAPAGQTPTSTVGELVAAGKVLQLGSEGQQAWKCIRTGSSSATANVAEALP